MPGAPPVVITSPYPLLALIVSVAIVAFCVPFVIYGVNHYSFSTVLMPAAAGIVAAAAATVRIPFDAWNYVQYRRARRQHLPAVEAAAVPEQLVLADELLVTMAATIGSPEAPPKAATGAGEVNRLVVDPDSDLGPGPPSHPHPDPEPAVPSRRSAGDDLPPSWRSGGVGTGSTPVSSWPTAGSPSSSSRATSSASRSVSPSSVSCSV